MLAESQPLRHGLGDPQAPDDQPLSAIPIRALTSMEPGECGEWMQTFKPILILPSTEGSLSGRPSNQ